MEMGSHILSKVVFIWPERIAQKSAIWFHLSWGRERIRLFLKGIPYFDYSIPLTRPSLSNVVA